MHVAVDRAQGERQGVVIGWRRSAVAADEAHHRPAVTLPRVELEVADDHPEVIEVPVQRLDVRGALHHDMSQPLQSGGFAGWPLDCIGAPQLMPEVEQLGVLWWQ